MLKERLETPRAPETLRRIGHLFYKLVSVANEAHLGDTNEGCAVLWGEKIHSTAVAAVSRPFDKNALVRFDAFAVTGIEMP
jgi:hypothetical protein